ncbi:hypothetical protein DFH07DRAFT_781080 [Mycena maculata]|uniref:Uncharacterized protein n=1 Tax=Mycena maculata TaxID=230809 RepID=A0AAD7MV30_9AGAR|nr:hypothetical protein DFH07DRAFT_781080 [Mycena maculata]
MGSPKSKPTPTRPKARPKVSASALFFDTFKHPLAYSLGLHLLSPYSIIDYARPELKAVVMGALPVLRYLKRNVDLPELSEQARVFYGGISRIMERLHTIPTEWYNFCVDEDIYPSDAASIIKVIPPACTKISLGPGDHRPLDKSFANFDQSDPTPAQIQGFLNNLPAVPPRSPSPNPESELEPGPVTSSSQLIARAAAPTGLTKKCSLDSADLDTLAQDKIQHSEAEPPLDAKPGRVRDLRKKKRARVESPEALPAKPKKGKKGKEKADSNKIPDAPQRAIVPLALGPLPILTRIPMPPRSRNLSRLVFNRPKVPRLARLSNSTWTSPATPTTLATPNDIYLYLIRKRAQLATEQFYTGHPATTAHH